MSTALQEWLNQNALRAYPFAEDARMRPYAPTDAFAIPTCLVVDFVLAVAGDADMSAHVTRLVKAGVFLSITWSASTGAAIGSITVASTTHTPNTAYAMTMTADYEDATGCVVIGDLARALAVLPDGDWSFEIGAARMETTTVRPGIRGVQALRVINGGAPSAWINGHVTLIAGQNIDLTVDTVAKSVRIDARESAGFNEECTCAEESKPNPIRRINGVNVEDLTLVGDGKCIDVQTTGSTIRLIDRCSKPCCGCPELDELSRVLTITEASIARLETYANTLTSKQGEFSAKLGTTMR